MYSEFIYSGFNQFLLTPGSISDLNEEGILITSMRPEVEIVKIYSELAFSGLREFLLTPGSRSDVGD